MEYGAKRRDDYLNPTKSPHGASEQMEISEYTGTDDAKHFQLRDDSVNEATDEKMEIPTASGNSGWCYYAPCLMCP